MKIRAPIAPKIKTITQVQKQSICRSHRKGRTVAALANRYHVSWGRIKKILRECGVKPRVRGTSRGKKTDKIRRGLKPAAKDEAPSAIEEPETLEVQVARLEAAMSHVKQLLALAQQTLHSVV